MKTEFNPIFAILVTLDIDLILQIKENSYSDFI